MSVEISEKETRKPLENDQWPRIGCAKEKNKPFTHQLRNNTNTASHENERGEGASRPKERDVENYLLINEAIWKKLQLFGRS